MDPLATWNLFKKTRGADKREAAMNLVAWKQGGGFVPPEVDMKKVTDYLKKPKRRSSSIMKEVAESLGLKAVRGAVSGKIYYE